VQDISPIVQPGNSNVLRMVCSSSYVFYLSPKRAVAHGRGVSLLMPDSNDEVHCGVVHLVSSVHPPSISVQASGSTRRSAAT
jgi:hypothetical protein